MAVPGIAVAPVGPCTSLNSMRVALGHLSGVTVPLAGVPSLQHLGCTTQAGVSRELTEGTLGPAVCAADKRAGHSTDLRDTARMDRRN